MRRNGAAARFPRFGEVGIGLATLGVKPHSPTERIIAMKFETLMLNSLFAACAVICVSTLAAMLV